MYRAHSVGHKVMHTGNHVWVYKNTTLGSKYEREANDFAKALLMDGREVMEAGLIPSREVA